MTSQPDLDPMKVKAAVRELLAKETARVDDPHFIPEDRAGWHPRTDPAPDARGQPYYDPNAWRWFALIDVGYVDQMILLTFRWTDPSTPELRYSYLGHADGLPSADAAAMVMRSQLRRLLEPGWRDRVERHWLSRTQVLIWEQTGQEPSHIPGVNEARRRSALRVEEQRSELWHSVRNASTD